MRAKIIFEFDFNPIDYSGINLDYIEESEYPLLLDFDNEKMLELINIKKENNYIYSEIEIKDDWLDLSPVVGCSKPGYSNSRESTNGSIHEFTRRFALGKGENSNKRVKSIREQLINQAFKI